MYIGLLLLVGLLTLEGCIKEDNPVVAETRNISMTMNVDTRAGGSDINVDIESAINTLRVYAFYGERKVGYFYGNDKNLVVMVENYLFPWVWIFQPCLFWRSRYLFI